MMIYQFLPFVPFFAVSIILIGILLVIRFWLKYRKKRSPFTENFLRNPGESLIKQIEDINYKIQYYLTGFLLAPMMIYSIHISQSYFHGEKESLLRISLSFITLIIFTTISITLLIKSLNKRRYLRFAYDGELAVGQQLNQLMRDGYYIFHDVPGKKFNIDHIVVGQSGVFAVETKARRKPILGDGRAEAEVIYDGHCLKFPKWTENKPIEQAIIQAKWLSNYLSNAVGEKIDAKPVVALPGWFVKKISAHGIPVINPKQFNLLLKKRELSEDMIIRIIHQLEQRCRDVEPNVNMEKKA